MSGFATPSTPLPTSASTSTLLPHTTHPNYDSSPPLPSNLLSSCRTPQQQQQPFFARDNHNNFFQRSLSSADNPLSNNFNNYNNVNSNYSDCNNYHQQQQNSHPQFGAPIASLALRHSNTTNDFGSAWGTPEQTMLQNNRRRFASTDHATQLMSALTLGNNSQQHNDVFNPSSSSQQNGGEHASLFSDIFSTAAAPSAELAAFTSSTTKVENHHPLDWTLSVPRYNNDSSSAWPNQSTNVGSSASNYSAVPPGTPWQLGQLLQDIDR